MDWLQDHGNRRKTKPSCSNPSEIPETYSVPLVRNEALILSLRTHYYLCLSLVAPGAVQMHKENREQVGSKPETTNESIKIMRRLRAEMERESRNGLNRVNKSTSFRNRYSKTACMKVGEGKVSKTSKDHNCQAKMLSWRIPICASWFICRGNVKILRWEGKVKRSCFSSKTKPTG